VLTANFTECDFKYMTQGVFVQDFPYKQESKGDVVTECLSPGESEFHRPLVEYLRRLYPMNQEARFLLNKAIKEIERCDFSSAEVALIPSVPGKHASNNSKWGRMRLESVLRRWCGANSAPIPSDSPLILQASSIGSLGKGEKYLAELTASMLVGSSENHHCKPPVELVWPTAECIRQSILGYCCGGSIPLRGDTIETVLADGSRVLKPGVESVLRKWDGSVSSRDLNPPHMKCYCRYSIVDAQDSVAEGGHNKRKASPTWVGSMKKLQKVDGDNTATSDETLDTTPANPAKIQLHWFLLSSANISQAAWGVSQRGGTQLYIKSFEMGVLFVPSMMKTFHRVFSCTPDHNKLGCPTGYGLRRSNESSSSGCKLFAFSHSEFIKQDPTPVDLHSFNRVSLPIPFIIPPPCYLPGDKPWICDKNYYEPDSCGRMWIPTP